MENSTPQNSAVYPQLAEEQRFFYLSPHLSLHAEGVFERISHPIAQINSFEAALKNAFRHAENCGIRNPVAIGAIPFDKSQPSNLVIPQSANFFQNKASALPSLENIKQGALRTVTNKTSTPSDKRFKQSVDQAVANFKLSDIRKSVLSRILHWQFDGPLNADSIFQQLVAQNPSGFHFAVPLHNGSRLVGVSPELLLRKHGNIIESNPLAGSAKRSEHAAEDKRQAERLLDSSKDLYEHQLVIEDIEQVLRPWCSELTIPSRPSLLSTKTMWHLSTSIQGRLADSSTNALLLGSKLHPTPAVCGFPTTQAHKLINLIESFDRGLFAGMVGWVDAEGNGEWVVTIRCGIVHHDSIDLFAGAGIVEGSCPEAELAETQAKLQTMLRALPLSVESPT